MLQPDVTGSGQKCYFLLFGDTLILAKPGHRQEKLEKITACGPSSAGDHVLVSDLFVCPLNPDVVGGCPEKPHIDVILRACQPRHHHPKPFLWPFCHSSQCSHIHPVPLTLYLGQM